MSDESYHEGHEENLVGDKFYALTRYVGAQSSCFLVCLIEFQCGDPWTDAVELFDDAIDDSECDEINSKLEPK